MEDRQTDRQRRDCTRFPRSRYEPPPHLRRQADNVRAEPDWRRGRCNGGARERNRCDEATEPPKPRAIPRHRAHSRRALYRDGVCARWRAGRFDQENRGSAGAATAAAGVSRGCRGRVGQDRGSRSACRIHSPCRASDRAAAPHHCVLHGADSGRHRLPARQRCDPPRHQERQHPRGRHLSARENCRLRLLSRARSHARAGDRRRADAQGHSLLDVARGHQRQRLRSKGGCVVCGLRVHRDAHWQATLVLAARGQGAPVRHHVPHRQRIRASRLPLWLAWPHHRGDGTNI
mmetsp:Transcript_35274/g.87978  ORF Transcript_35274/g.87978 Transcript_35274/m.87978 type:complete len:290 (+) Transcript_35274:1161-2030(+)